MRFYCLSVRTVRPLRWYCGHVAADIFELLLALLRAYYANEDVYGSGYRAAYRRHITVGGNELSTSRTNRMLRSNRKQVRRFGAFGEDYLATISHFDRSTVYLVARDTQITSARLRPSVFAGSATPKYIIISLFGNGRARRVDATSMEQSA